MYKGKPYKYKVNILYNNETTCEYYCNDVSQKYDYLLLFYDDNAKDCEIICLRNVARFRIREVDV